MGFPGGAVVKNLPANAGDARDAGLIPGSGRAPGEGKGNPLQYSGLENPMDSGSLAGYNPRGQKGLDTTIFRLYFLQSVWWRRQLGFKAEGKMVESTQSP